MPSRFLVMTLLLPAACGLLAADRLTNAAAAVAFVEAPTGGEREFAMTGTVTVTLNRHAIVLTDATGSIHLRCDESLIPAKGDLVRVRGKSFTDANHETILKIGELVRLGNSVLPAPRAATFEDILRGKCLYRNVITGGLVVNALRDDIDTRYNHLILKSGPHLLHATLPERIRGERPIEDYIGAEVEVSGICLRNYGGARVIVGTFLVLDDDAVLRIVRPASDAPCEAPPLEDLRHVEPALVTEMGLRSVEGTVIAVWHGNRFMVRTDEGRGVIVTLAGARTPPVCGSRVLAAGFPETDLFHINLGNASFRPSNRAPVMPDARRVDIAQLYSRSSKSITTRYHAHAITVRGILRGTSEADSTLNLECGDDNLPVDVSALPDLSAKIAPGSLVDVSGVCIIEADSWRPSDIFPCVTRFRIVPRSPEDIRVIVRPPWWTPERLTIVIGSLLAALIAILVWNRILNHLVEHRSRELLKERLAHSASELKIGERTRLAVELHDSLSQNLEGVACQLVASRNMLKANPQSAEGCLDTAERMLDSCRLELRRCLFDLRGHALEAQNFEDAIHSTLAPLCDGVDLVVRFDVRRAHFDDTTVHAVLCMVRELVSNALRHGRATQIRVAGEYHDGTLSFSVRDNGCGFDTEARLGPSQGHFGLEGIRERAERFNGNAIFESRSGAGTRIAVTLHLSEGKDPEPA